MVYRNEIEVRIASVEVEGGNLLSAMAISNGCRRR